MAQDCVPPRDKTETSANIGPPTCSLAMRKHSTPMKKPRNQNETEGGSPGPDHGRHGHTSIRHATILEPKPGIEGGREGAAKTNQPREAAAASPAASDIVNARCHHALSHDLPLHVVAQGLDGGTRNVPYCAGTTTDGRQESAVGPCGGAAATWLLLAKLRRYAFYEIEEHRRSRAL